MPKKDPKSPEPRLPALDPLQRYGISETDALLRQSRTKTYEDISNGVLKVIKDGKRTYVPGTEIIRRSALLEA